MEEWEERHRYSYETHSVEQFYYSSLLIDTSGSPLKVPLRRPKMGFDLSGPKGVDATSKGE